MHEAMRTTVSTTQTYKKTFMTVGASFPDVMAINGESHIKSSIEVANFQQVAAAICDLDDLV